MDENKRKVLQAIGYRFSTCGFCNNGEFPQNEWGTCKLYTYEHLKHTGEPRQLSVHKSGTCKSFSAKPSEVSKLGLFQEFVK